MKIAEYIEFVKQARQNTMAPEQPAANPSVKANTPTNPGATPTTATDIPTEPTPNPGSFQRGLGQVRKGIQSGWRGLLSIGGPVFTYAAPVREDASWIKDKTLKEFSKQKWEKGPQPYDKYLAPQGYAQKATMDAFDYMTNGRGTIDSIKKIPSKLRNAPIAIKRWMEKNPNPTDPNLGYTYRQTVSVLPILHKNYVESSLRNVGTIAANTAAFANPVLAVQIPGSIYTLGQSAVSKLLEDSDHPVAKNIKWLADETTIPPPYFPDQNITKLRFGDELRPNDEYIIPILEKDYQNSYWLGDVENEIIGSYLNPLLEAGPLSKIRQLKERIPRKADGTPDWSATLRPLSLQNYTKYLLPSQYQESADWASSGGNKQLTNFRPSREEVFNMKRPDNELTDEYIDDLYQKALLNGYSQSEIKSAIKHYNNLVYKDANKLKYMAMSPEELAKEEGYNTHYTLDDFDSGDVGLGITPGIKAKLPGISLLNWLTNRSFNKKIDWARKVADQDTIQSLIPRVIRDRQEDEELLSNPNRLAEILATKTPEIPLPSGYLTMKNPDDYLTSYKLRYLSNLPAKERYKYLLEHPELRDDFYDKYYKYQDVLALKNFLADLRNYVVQQQSEEQQRQNDGM